MALVHYSLFWYIWVVKVLSNHSKAYYFALVTKMVTKANRDTFYN
jgi:hypothetical protein